MNIIVDLVDLVGPSGHDAARSTTAHMPPPSSAQVVDVSPKGLEGPKKSVSVVAPGVHNGAAKVAPPVEAQRVASPVRLEEAPFVDETGDDPFYAAGASDRVSAQGSCTAMSRGASTVQQPGLGRMSSTLASRGSQSALRSSTHLHRLLAPASDATPSSRSAASPLTSANVAVLNVPPHPSKSAAIHRSQAPATAPAPLASSPRSPSCTVMGSSSIDANAPPPNLGATQRAVLVPLTAPSAIASAAASLQKQRQEEPVDELMRRTEFSARQRRRETISADAPGTTPTPAKFLTSTPVEDDEDLRLGDITVFTSEPLPGPCFDRKEVPAFAAMDADGQPTTMLKFPSMSEELRQSIRQLSLINCKSVVRTIACHEVKSPGDGIVAASSHFLVQVSPASFEPIAPIDSVAMTCAPLSMERIVKIGRNVSMALRNLHARGVMSGGLRPRSIVQLPNREYGLCLLCSIRSIAGSHGVAGFVAAGATGYCFDAPEVCAGSSEVGCSADVWSLGVIFYLWSVGRLPFERIAKRVDFVAELKSITGTEIAVPTHATNGSVLPKGWRHLIARMLVVDPTKRVTSKELRDLLNGSPVAIGVLDKLM